MLAFLIGILLTSSGVARADDEGAKDILKVPIAQARSFRKKALVIGINRYRLPIASLKASATDAKNFAAFLRNEWGFPADGITLLTDDGGEEARPTSDNILRAADLFVKSIRPDDEVVFFYSGHGTRAGNSDYLVPSNAYIEDIARTGFNFDNWRAALQTRRPARALLITDACRNLLEGKATGRGSGYGASEPVKARQFAEIRSCAPTEISWEMPDESGSVFTHFLLQGLRGDAEAREGNAVTYESLMDYVSGHVSAYAVRNLQAVQTPEGLASTGRMVLAKWDEAPVAKPPVVAPPVFVPPILAPPVAAPPVIVPPVLAPSVVAPAFDGSTLRVSALGRGDYTSLSAAIQAAKAGTRIIVESGYYSEPSGITIDKPLEIIGPGIAPGQAPATIECMNDNTLVMDTDYALVRGLTLRCKAVETETANYAALYVPKGKLLLESCDLSSSGGSGIYIGGTGDPQVRDCRIHDNEGTGVVVYQNGQGTLENCDIFGNAFSGVAIKQNGNPQMRDCKMRDNKQGGIFVYENGQGILENCDIFGNAFSGVEVDSGGNPTLRGCRIHDNKNFGISVCENGQGILENCDIFGNAFSGVGIDSGGNPTLRGCRINRNNGQAIRASEGGLGAVENCNLTGNTQGPTNISADSRVTLSNNILK